jgi:hypothetical protein
LRLDPDSDPRESNQCGSRPTTLPPFVNFLRLLGKPTATITTTITSAASAAIIVSSGNGTTRRGREKGILVKNYFGSNSVPDL